MVRSPITVTARPSGTRTKAIAATRTRRRREAIAVFHFIEQGYLIGIETLDEFGAGAGKRLKLLSAELLMIGAVLDASLSIAAARRLIGFMPLDMICFGLGNSLRVAVKGRLLIALEAKFLAHGAVIGLNVSHHGTCFRSCSRSRSLLSRGRHRNSKQTKHGDGCGGCK